MQCKCCGEEFTPREFAYMQKYCDFCKYLTPIQRRTGYFFKHKESKTSDDVNYRLEWQKWKLAHHD